MATTTTAWKELSEKELEYIYCITYLPRLVPIRIIQHSSLECIRMCPYKIAKNGKTASCCLRLLAQAYTHLSPLHLPPPPLPLSFPRTTPSYILRAQHNNTKEERKKTWKGCAIHKFKIQVANKFEQKPFKLNEVIRVMLSNGRKVSEHIRIQESPFNLIYDWNSFLFKNVDARFVFTPPAPFPLWLYLIWMVGRIVGGGPLSVVQCCTDRLAPSLEIV